MYEDEFNKQCEICGRAYKNLLEISIPDPDEDGNIRLGVCRDCSDSVFGFIENIRNRFMKDYDIIEFYDGDGMITGVFNDTFDKEDFDEEMENDA